MDIKEGSGSRFLGHSESRQRRFDEEPVEHRAEIVPVSVRSDTEDSAKHGPDMAQDRSVHTESCKPQYD